MSLSKILPRIFKTFPIGLRLGADLRSRRKCIFYQEKHRERENNNRKRNVCTERGMGTERETTRRERPGEKKGDALIVWYTRGEEVGNVGENDQKRRAIWRLLSFSSHCSPLSLLFTFPVPRSPFSELHAPNPTSDPHKGRRGRNTFGKSSSTPLQRIRTVSQKSLVPRYVGFSDSLGGGGAHAEWETDSSSVWSILRDVWCESKDHLRISSHEKVKAIGIL